MIPLSSLPFGELLSHGALSNDSVCEMTVQVFTSYDGPARYLQWEIWTVLFTDAEKIEKSNKIQLTLIIAQCLYNQMFVGKFPIK